MSYTPNQEKITINSSGDLSAGAVTATSVTATGAVSAASVTASGAVSAASVSSSGAVTTASVSASGAVSASTVTTSSTVTSGGNLSVTGTIYASGDITAFSDAALKEDVRPIENALDKVSSLTGVTYLKDGKLSVGLIAQNVESIIPEAVLKGGDYKSVAYGNLVGVLIEAIKELNAELKELKEKV